MKQVKMKKAVVTGKRTLKASYTIYDQEYLGHFVSDELEDELANDFRQAFNKEIGIRVRLLTADAAGQLQLIKENPWLLEYAEIEKFLLPEVQFILL